MFSSDDAYFTAKTEVADRKQSCRKALGGERAKTAIAPPAGPTSIQAKPPAVRRGSVLKPFPSLWDEGDQKLRWARKLTETVPLSPKI